MSTLTEIMSALEDVYNLVDENQGELDDDLEAQLDQVEGELSTKINSCLRYVDTMQALSIEYKDRASKYRERSASLQKQADRLKDYVLQCLKRDGREKYHTEDYPEIKIRKGPPSVHIINVVEFEKAHPEWMREKTTVTPDKVAIKEALNNGQAVQWVEIVRQDKIKY